MVVRELFALLGIHTDMASVEKADGAINGLKQAATALGTLFVTGVVASGLTKFVRMAADVEETTTLLDTVFGESSQSVKEWASKTSEVVGRSEYQLRDFASKIGAIAAPMMGTGEATAKLSTDLTQLAVDLASVFNTADDEALVALRSGLLGESEPMRRFGVNLLDSELERFASSQGMAFKGLSTAQKMHLRYQYILKMTAMYQGNANRELDSFTNSSKYLATRLMDVGIRIGEVLLPFATKLVHWAIAGVNGFMRLAQGTKIFEAALIGLATTAVALGIKLAIPFAPAIAAATALAAAIGAVIIVAEDLYQFFTGGLSVTGMLVDRFAARFPKLAAVFGRLRDVALGVWASISAKGSELGAKLGPLVGKAVDFIAEKFGAFLGWLEPKLSKALDGKLVERFAARFPKLGAVLGKLRDVALRVWAAITTKGSELGAKLGPLVGKAVDFIAAKFDAFLTWVEPKLNQLLDWVGPKIDELMNVDWDAKLKAVTDFFAGFGDQVSKFMEGEGPSSLVKLLAALAGGIAGYKLGGISGAASGAIGGAAMAGSDTAQGILGAQGGSVLGALLGAKFGGRGMRGLALGALGSAAGGVLGGMFGRGDLDASIPDAAKNVSIRNESTVTVNGTASQEQKEEVRRIWREEQERSTRELREALVPSYGKL